MTAATPIAIPLPIEGATLYSLRLSPTATAVGSQVTLTLTEDGSIPGLYRCTNSGNQSGIFAFAVLFDGSAIVADGFAVIDDTTDEILIGSDGASLTDGHVQAIINGVTAVADQIQAAQSNVITIIEGDKLTQQFTGLGSLAGRDNLVWCLKANLADADDDSLLMVDESTGLLRLNKAAAGDAARATLVVDDEDAGDVTLTIFADITDQLTSGHRVDGLKVIENEGEDRHVRRGRVDVQTGPVEALGTVS